MEKAKFESLVKLRLVLNKSNDLYGIENSLVQCETLDEVLSILFNEEEMKVFDKAYYELEEQFDKKLEERLGDIEQTIEILEDMGLV